MTCKDCLHCEICEIYYANKGGISKTDSAEECNWFEDKTLYVKSPCKVGDTVYAIQRGEIVPLRIEAIYYNKYCLNIFARNERVFGYGNITLDARNVIGIEWYKTKQEAEQKLRR